MTASADPDDAGRIGQLERRLERERTARAEAEASAERGTLELHEEKRRLHLLETIAAESNLSADVQETLRRTLGHICQFTDWPLGQVYVLDSLGAAPAMVFAGLWHVAAGRDFREFREASAAMRFPAGVGMPGRVLASADVAWVPDVTLDANFPRAAMAQRDGLHASFAFPVLVGDEVAAVLEFFSDKTIEPDAELLRIMAQAGAHLGRVIERSRAEARMRAHNTELERLIAEAEAQRAAAEAASRAKSAFLAVTSHEVRTPLNAVLGLAEALRREPLSPAQHGLVNGVLESGAMLLRLLNAVLDLSKVEAGKMTLQAAPFDLRRTAERIIEIWRPRADELAVRLQLDLDGPDGAWLVTSDEGKIEQTLVNLLSNALKFSPPGGKVTMRCAARLEAGSWRLRFEVIDEGQGVPTADRARIFQPFEQTDAGRDAGGAGLGLSICAGNLDLLGGAMGVEPGAAGGSRFWLSFAAEPAAGAAPTAGGPDRADGPGHGLRVLVAEDNPTNRQVLDLLLRPTGVSLSFVGDGAAALSAVQTEAFDLVLMDVHMPTMDGVEALRSIRALGGGFGRLPIYMVTANVFDEDIRRYMAAGADGVLKKPIDVRELYATLGDAADHAIALRTAS